MTCQVCKHDEATHTRRLSRQRYGFKTKVACGECACVEFVPPADEVCGMCISPYVACRDHENRSQP